MRDRLVRARMAWAAAAVVLVGLMLFADLPFRPALAAFAVLAAGSLVDMSDLTGSGHPVPSQEIAKPLVADWLIETVISGIPDPMIVLEHNGNVLARAGWSARVMDRDRRLCDQIAAKLQQAGWAPPGAEELAAAFGEPLPRVGAMMRLLGERGILVRLDDRVWMHRDAVEAGKQTALKLFARAPMFSTMEFRDALGVSRKYAVPLVDHLDKVRFTVRSGNNRTPGAEAKKLLNPKS